MESSSMWPSHDGILSVTALNTKKFTNLIFAVWSLRILGFQTWP